MNEVILQKKIFNKKIYDAYIWFIILKFLINIALFIYLFINDSTFLSIQNIVVYLAPSLFDFFIYYSFRLYLFNKLKDNILKNIDIYIMIGIYFITIYDSTFFYRIPILIMILPIIILFASIAQLDKQLIFKETCFIVLFNFIIECYGLVNLEYGVVDFFAYIFSIFIFIILDSFCFILIDYINELLEISNNIYKKQELLNNNLNKAINDLKIEPMTGLYNKKALQDDIELKIKTMKTNKNIQNIGIAILDLDFFKKVNDTYGHDIGDRVLLALTEVIKKKTKKKAKAYRFGGEEFVILFEKQTPEEAFNIINDLRISFNKIVFTYMDGKRLTLSSGITFLKRGDTYDAFFKRADEALYESKETGRNKVTMK